MTIVDLGAAPGGWSQIAAEIVKPKGYVIALDILPMEPLKDVDVFQGDFTDDQVFNDLLTRLTDRTVDWVISDMAPNLSGIDSVDQAKSLSLAEAALDFAIKINVENFLVKVFQGEGFDAFLKEIKKHFQKVSIRKPKASRGRSREVYILARRCQHAF